MDPERLESLPGEIQDNWRLIHMFTACKHLVGTADFVKTAIWESKSVFHSDAKSAARIPGCAEMRIGAWDTLDSI
jgi:hypothetical protein